ncbi:MAG: 5-oxoprolinase subunit PxpA [Hydrogenibacillus schlegelii]|nr:5-oxoprolinase subunit PxpA [Hydrogenibacillus schlegelii]
MRLDEAAIEAELRRRPEWVREDETWIVRRYRFPSFPAAMAFAQAVGEIAEAAGHHPLIAVDYRVVTLRLSSWQAGGLTALDFDLADRFDAAYRRFVPEERPAERAIDLNADVGEAAGEAAALELELLSHLSSVNVACGFHAGDPDGMVRTVRAALAAGVAVGAHPGLPDRFGFGRRWMDLAPAEIEAIVLYQLGALAAIVRAEGGRLAHVKPHGALYNRAADDPAVAAAIVRSVLKFDAGLFLYVLAGSTLERAAREAGLRVVREGFADRAYTADGRLLSRRDPRAVHRDPTRIRAQALHLAAGEAFPSADGTPVRMAVDSICLHGDTPEAVAHARVVREVLEAAGFAVRPPGGG